MFDEAVHRIAAQAFAVALLVALATVPLCMRLARKLGVVDKPGGRKTHEKVTPLLGGVGVVLGAFAGLLVVWLQEGQLDQSLVLGDILFVVWGSLIIFVVGLVDDLFKDSMAFEPKLLGQIAGVVVLMWPTLSGLIESGGRLDQWLYQLFFLGWYLTIVNSFNFSDNMNGLMSGLSVVSFGAAILYLSGNDSTRSMMIAVVLVAALVGFLPYNFPRSRVFLGDAGSMFVGFWMAWIQFDLVKGFMGVARDDFGASHLIPAVLMMGIPLYDAAFVVFMRLKEKRPVYLGDNHHLSHRLVRGGFSPAEAVVILWGLALILAWLGILASQARGSFRYLIFGASFLFMTAVTRKIIDMERLARDAALTREAAEAAEGDGHAPHGGGGGAGGTASAS